MVLQETGRETSLFRTTKVRSPVYSSTAIPVLTTTSTSPNTPPDDTSGQEKATNQKRKRIESQRGRSPDTAAAAVAAEPTRYQDNSTHHAQQARLVIQNEIDSRRDGKDCFSDERWKILQSAVKLVDKMSRGEQVVSQDTPMPAPDPSIDVPSNPPAELLFMLLPGLWHPVIQSL